MRYNRHDKVFPRLARDLGIAGASLLIGAAAVTVTASQAATQQPKPQGTVVACSATEDSYLTDCHGHRLQYAHGEWTAPQLLPTQAQLKAPLPHWFHAMTAPRYVARDSCGKWPKFGLKGHINGTVVEGVEVWALHTDGAVYCQDGHISGP